MTGTVKDEQGGVLPGVTVTLTGKTGSRTAVTDTEGAYRFAGLDPGTYSVTAEISGFRPKRQDNVAVSMSRVADIHIVLGVGGVTENIDVVGESPIIDASLELDRQRALPGHALQPADPAHERRDRHAQLPSRHQQRLLLRHQRGLRERRS